MFCKECGAEINDKAEICPKCGCRVRGVVTTALGLDSKNSDASPNSRLLALLLCWFVGVFGVHRFYVGKIGTGVIWLLTCGCCGIGTLIDLIMIICGKFKDKEDRPVSNWSLDF